MHVGFCVSGSGRLFRAAVRHQEEIAFTPALVIGDTKADPGLEDYCAEGGIHFVRLGSTDRKQFGEEITEILESADLDLLCLTFDRIVPPNVVRLLPERIINVHPALLPSFKGMRGIEQALSTGVRFAGATIHEVDEAVDNGPVIAQCVLGIRRGETESSVGARMFGPLRLMFLQVLSWYAENRVEKDADGRIWISGATYGEFPISPAVERGFPD